MPGQHAKFAPSASPRWLACPGSLSMSEGIEESTSIYAHEGLVCHDVAARCLKENLTAEDFSGETIEGVFMEADLIEGIQMYVDEVRGQTKELGVKGGKIEYTVHITEDCWGTLDAMMWNEEVLLIDDLKMGKGVIVPADTSQMKVYAVGALMWLQTEHGLAPKTIRTVIIQPRTVNPIRPAEYTRDELIEWYKTVLKPTMEDIKNGKVVCIPGETQCRWCPAAGVCTAQADFAIREASNAFKPFTEHEAPTVQSPTESPTLDLQAMATLKKSFKFIEDWIGSINSIVMTAALEGTVIPGFKLVEGRSNRRWKGDDDQVESFLLSRGIEPFEKRLKTGPAVEKELGKKKAGLFKLEDQMHKPKGSPTLVDESDSRATYTFEKDVEQEFEEFVKSGTVIVDTYVGTGEAVGPAIIKTATSGSPETNEFGDEVKPYTLMQRLAMQDMEDDPQVDTEPDMIDNLLGGTSATEADEVTEDMGMFAEAMDGATGMEQAIVAERGAMYLATVDNRGANPEVTIVQTAAKSERPVLPKDTTKRHTVLSMGRGGASLEDVAKALNCGVNSVKMHVRYLHERDGFGYELYSDETFKIIE